ncbi:MarR family protein [Izhakiella capsodis]|uniref:MarR family protein n=1 Tax=Izhakiella capsodis TaxID=1367852 RepID=A0A1I5BTB8_9GAMM|nr:MarR family transcriptional regulator [Izhakiella capsodis]SFN77907.1 MarR family protein [Izhakiella capsodis]
MKTASKAITELLSHGMAYRIEKIVEKTGFKKSTVSSALRELQAAGLVVKEKDPAFSYRYVYLSANAPQGFGISRRLCELNNILRELRREKNMVHA